MEQKKQNESQEKNNLIAVIRISGLVKTQKEIKETLERLRLKRKYSCTLINPKNKNLIGMLKKVKFNTSYGEIEKSTLIKLLKSRAEKLDKSKDISPEKIAEDLIQGKKLQELNIKPFFRLHPPRKGIHSKLQYPKGVLGDNKKDINKLIEKML